MRGRLLSSGKRPVAAVSIMKKSQAFSCQPAPVCVIALPMPGIFCSSRVTQGLHGGPETTWERLRQLLPDCRIVCLKQIHSDVIARAEDISEGDFPEADGVISCDPSVVLCVRTADCVPVLMWADDAPVIAAVHAGWRGLALKIVPKAVQCMVASGARRVHVSMGPAIGPCCYAVGREVIEALRTEPDRHLDGRLFVDLHRVLRNQVIETGIAPENVHQVKACTCCSGSSYYSYRRDGEFTGRNVSAIGGKSCSLPGLPVP
jgi:YfiH family protein